MTNFSPQSTVHSPQKRRNCNLSASSIFFILASVFCIIYSVFPLHAQASPTINKQFTYHIYWLGIKAGEAVFDYTDSPEGITIQTHATSAPFISVFYKVDDTARTQLYHNGYPRQFILKIHEGSHRRHKITDFGPVIKDMPQKVVFSNILKNEISEFELERPAFDPLSAFHQMATLDIEVGKSAFIDIFDNKKLWNTEIQVLRKEKVHVPAGEFDTIVIKPLLKSEGIFLRKGEMHIWVTDDERKIPVLFTSKAKIGHFRVELAEGDY